MSSRCNSVVGKGNTAVSGHGNIVGSKVSVYASPSKPLTKSCVYKLLKTVMTSRLTEFGDYSLVDTATFNEKLSFNGVIKYKHFFYNHTSDLMTISSVIETFPDSEIIVKKLADLYYDCVDYDDEGDPIAANGDDTINRVLDKLFCVIVNDGAYSSDDVSREEVEQFCIALVQYGVIMCKVLLNPKEHASN